MAWIFQHSATEMDKMWRVWEQRGEGCLWWVQEMGADDKNCKREKKKTHMPRKERDVDKDCQLEGPVKGSSWIGWSRNQYRCFRWSLTKKMLGCRESTLMFKVVKTLSSNMGYLSMKCMCEGEVACEPHLSSGVVNQPSAMWQAWCPPALPNETWPSEPSSRPYPAPSSAKLWYPSSL